MNDLRRLPPVDALLRTARAEAWTAEYGRPLALEAVRRALEEVRSRYPDEPRIPAEAELLDRAAAILADWTLPTLRGVVNATGVIIHTNLGRSPLSPAALQAAVEVSQGYSTLEFDLESGKRGSRLLHAEALLRRLTGAEAAIVVNNNAAAVLLALTALAQGRPVVISRSQLVEIGGGFRIPDVMAQSGARLVEVGATNRVHLYDYRSVLEEEEKPALVMRAHRSNFRIIGFTSEPALEEIVELAHAHGVPVVDDLGSGALLDTARFGLAHEPTVQESLEAGADLVCFSGDKLLGGPQAGIVAGRRDLVARLKRHPLARAVRADKLALAALSATLLHYLKDEAETAVPVWRMIAAPAEAIRARAETWAQALGAGDVVPAESTVGGGSLPGETLPTFALRLAVADPDRFLAQLRRAEPPVIARLQDDRVLLDPRTVLPEQEDHLLETLRQALNGRPAD